MHFAYLKDPLFLACFGVYWSHRWLAAWGVSTPFLRSYLNDFLCIGFWVPVLVWLSRRLRLRSHDGPPDAVEILVPLVIWSVIFEGMPFLVEQWHLPLVLDPNDVLAYCAGAFAAAAFWRWRYRSTGMELSK